MNTNVNLYPYIDGEYVRLHMQPDRGFLIWKDKDILSEKGIIINLIGSEIVQCLNGLNNIEEIIKKFTSKYQDNYNRVYLLVTNFIVSLVEEYNVPLKLLEKPEIHKILITGSREYVQPVHAAIELTYKCNLRCKHCYINAGVERMEIMPLKMAKKILYELNNIGVMSVEITGGEPTMHPSFLDIIKYASNLNFSLIAILTNGTLLADTMLKEIDRYKGKIAFQVDLHGDNPKYVEWFTGEPHVFEKEISTIKKLVKFGFKVRIASSITVLNLNQMKSIASIANNIGVDNIVFSPIVPSGRACKTNDNQLILSYDKSRYSEFISNIEDLRNTYGGKFISVYDNANLNQSVNCGAGTRSIAITPQGFIKICQMGQPLTFLGSLFNRRLDDMLKDQKDLTSLLIKLPYPSNRKCNGCKNLWYCYHCINRGLQKASEEGESCIWGRKHIIGTPLEKMYAKLP